MYVTCRQIKRYQNKLNSLFDYEIHYCLCDIYLEKFSNQHKGSPLFVIDFYAAFLIFLCVGIGIFFILININRHLSSGVALTIQRAIPISVFDNTVRCSIFK